MILHKGIKRILLEKNLTVVALAKILGVSMSTIYRNVGEGSNPTLSTLQRYADALDVKVSYIILRAEEF